MFVSQKWSLILSVAIAMIAFQQSGFLIGWSSPVLLQLQGPNSSISLTSDEGAWVTSAMPLTSAFTTPLPALSMHFLGRKLTILISVIPLILCWILISISNSYTELIIARIIAGIGISFVYTIVPVYLGEISPDNIRGGIGIGMNMMAQIGIFWIYYIGTYPELWISSVTCIVPLFIVIVFYKFLPESPYFLVEKGKLKEAKASLEKLKNGKIDDELMKIQSSMITDNKNNALKEIFTEKCHQRALFICLGTYTFAQLTGGTSFLYYAHLILQKSSSYVSADTMVLIKAFLQVLSCLFAAYVVDKIGRKPLLIVSSIGSAVFMFTEGIYFYLQDNNYNVDSIWWLPLASMVLFNISQVIGLNSISVAYMGELYHPKIKSLAVCISKGYLSLLVSVVGKLFQVMTDELGNSVPFFVFALVGVIGVIFVIFCIPETKGKSLEEIQYYMKHKTFEKVEIN